MRIDAHQHFWHLSRGDYEWLTPELTVLYQDFLPEQLHPHLAACEIDGTVLVQAAATVAETEFMLSLAAQHDFIQGVVGWVDTVAPNACQVLARLQQNPYFKGIRPMLQDIPDVDWMLQDALTPVFDYLVAHGLTFDALVTPKHLPNVLMLLQRHPDLRVVIDHAAKPAIRDGHFDSWARDMQRIAEQTQAYCKVSGLLTEAGSQAGLQELSPYVDHLFECFGSERMMWGSDWPVLQLASDYRAWYDMTQQYVQRLPVEQQHAVMGHNAMRFYGLVEI